MSVFLGVCFACLAKVLAHNYVILHANLLRILDSKFIMDT